ncbi:MAG: hypothetical protein AB7S78_13010 [Candidatus Omnitrophota bacterium]
MKTKSKRGPAKSPGKHAFTRFEKRPAGTKRPFKYGDGEPEQSKGYDSFKKREPWRSPSPERTYIKSDVPEKKTVVPADKLRQGVRRSQEEINDFVNDIVSSLKVNKNIKSVEIDLGFDLSGKFIGVGPGADATIRIKAEAE